MIKRRSLMKEIKILMIITLLSVFIVPQAGAQFMPYYYPGFSPFYFVPDIPFMSYIPFTPYIPFIPSIPMVAPSSIYPSRNALALLPTPGGGTPLTVLLALAPAAPVAATPTLGVTTAILLAGGGGISATALFLLTAPATPTVTPIPVVPTVATPTIGVTTALLLGGGGVSTTTLLLLGI